MTITKEQTNCSTCKLLKWFRSEVIAKSLNITSIASQTNVLCLERCLHGALYSYHLLLTNTYAPSYIH
jgi:hypothetical protein